MQGFIFFQSDFMSLCEVYIHLTGGLDSLNEKMFLIYLNCTIAPICCHYKQFFREDPCSELAITSQQFYPLFPPLPAAKMKALLLYIVKGSCLSQSKSKRRKRKLSNYLSFDSVCFSVNTLCMKSGKSSCNACLACKPASILILMMSLLVG